MSSGSLFWTQTRKLEAAEPPASPEEALAVVEEYRATGHSLREACRLAAEETGYTKNELYALAVRNG